MKWISAVFFLLASVAVAGTREPGTPDEKHLSYGSGFKCVLPIACRTEEGLTASASCVALSHRWVVTAAHVVDKCDQWRVHVGDRKIQISKMIVHEKFKPEECGWHDIAVGFAEEDIGLAHYPALYGNADEDGKVCSIAGWGIAGTMSEGATLADGRRRAGSNFVDRIDRGVLVCSVVGGKRTELEFLIASGDSGGGLFIDGKLAGVNSFLSTVGKPPRSVYGEESNHTRISIHREWIYEHALRHVSN